MNKHLKLFFFILLLFLGIYGTNIVGIVVYQVYLDLYKGVFMGEIGIFGLE